jgi:non-lysosomal glucosylceramidase
MASNRRSFFKQAGLAAAAAQVAAPRTSNAPAPSNPSGLAPVAYPRVFTGRHLAQIAFPLGGVGAGSIALGGRGQLRDWEIFNRPDKGRSLAYAFPAIAIQDGRQKIARVLEARLLPPFTGQDGLGARNAPGLTRLASARFTGEYPLARIDFEDPALPVRVSLEAFSPFIPHEGDDSGLPVAILRYRVRNTAARPISASIAWSIENPVLREQNPGRFDAARANEYRAESPLTGLFMTNPAMDAADPMHGSFVLALLGAADGDVTHLAGWPKGKWWDAPLLFWDDFSSDGKLGPEAADHTPIGALCLGRHLAPGAERDYTFLLAWHFPNRTPARCGWTAPPGDENTVIGNWCTTRFPDAWGAASYAAQNLETP